MATNLSERGVWGGEWVKIDGEAKASKKRKKTVIFEPEFSNFFFGLLKAFNLVAMLKT